MKRMFFIASALILSVGAFAQHEEGTLTVQPKIGLNIANYTGSDDTDPRIGLVAGAEFEYQLTKMFSLSASLLYSMQGAKESGRNESGSYLEDRLYQYPYYGQYLRDSWTCIEAGHSACFQCERQLYSIDTGYRH